MGKWVIMNRLIIFFIKNEVALLNFVEPDDVLEELGGVLLFSF